MTRDMDSLAAKTIVWVTMLVTLVLALLGGLAGQARAQETTQGSIVPHVTCGDEDPVSRFYGAWLGYTSTYIGDKTLEAGSQYNYMNPGILKRGQPSVFSPGRHDYTFFVAFDRQVSSRLFWIVDGSFVGIPNRRDTDPLPVSCGAMQGQDPTAPETVTSPASGLAPTGATLNAVVNPNGADTSYRFQYATEADYDPNATDPYGSRAPAQDGSVAASGGAQLASATLDALQPGTIYHYRVVATNSVGTMSGEDRTFTTPDQPPPNVDLSLAQTATPGRAALGQKITYALSATNNGGATATGVRVVAPLPDGAGFVADESSPGCSESVKVVTCRAETLDGGQSAAFDVVLAPSVPGVLANNAAVAADQPDPNPLNNSATARSTLVAPPQVTTSPASGLGTSTATLGGLIDPKGEAATYHFEYVPDVDYDTNVPDPYAAGVKTSPQSVTGGEARNVSHDLSGLSPNTTYHYRLVATNGLGSTMAGADQTFTTPAQSPANRPPTADNDAYTVSEDGQLVVEAPGVLDGDADPDGDTLSAAKVEGPAHGTLYLQPNGFFLYTPNKDFNGTDSFTYKASDGTDESDAATVRIGVTPVDEPPPTNTVPTITTISPTPGSKIRDRTPTASAKVMDSETNLSKGNIRLWVDGKRVEGFSYDRTTHRLSYTTKELDRGRHTVLIKALDGQGLSASRLWGFGVVKR